MDLRIWGKARAVLVAAPSWICKVAPEFDHGGDFMILQNQWTFDFLEEDLSAGAKHFTKHLFEGKAV